METMANMTTISTTKIIKKIAGYFIIFPLSLSLGALASAHLVTTHDSGELTCDDPSLYTAQKDERGVPFNHRKQLLTDLDQKFEEFRHLNESPSPLSQFESSNENLNYNIKKVITINSGYSIYRYEIGQPKAPWKVLITSGIHAGTEPHSVVVALNLINDLIKNHKKFSDVYFVIYPNLNPWGFLHGTRENEEHIDLNRVFKREKIESDSMQIVANSLHDESFNLAMDLHGGIGRKTFFAIRSKDDQGLSERAMQFLGESQLLLESTSKQYPDYAHHAKFSKRYCLVAPGVSETKTPGTLKSHVSQISDFAYTMEYPGKLTPLEIQSKFQDLIYSYIEKLRFIPSNPKGIGASTVELESNRECPD